jgi:uncharacterized protein (TIGR03435 family)
MVPSAATSALADAADHRSVFAALQEQLGRKLEPRREMIDLVVIDHADIPTTD